MRVDVLHNLAPEAATRGFCSTDPLLYVQQFDVEQEHDQETLAHVYWLTTVAHQPEATSGRPDSQAVSYRSAGHRHLRTGDVVVIGSRVWACARRGWTLLSTEALPAEPAGALPAGAAALA